MQFEGIIKTWEGEKKSLLANNAASKLENTTLLAANDIVTSENTHLLASKAAVMSENSNLKAANAALVAESAQIMSLNAKLEAANVKLLSDLELSNNKAAETIIRVSDVDRDATSANLILKTANSNLELEVVRLNKVIDAQTRKAARVATPDADKMMAMGPPITVPVNALSSPAVSRKASDTNQIAGSPAPLRKLPSAPSPTIKRKEEEKAKAREDELAKKAAKDDELAKKKKEEDEKKVAKQKEEDDKKVAKQKEEDEKKVAKQKKEDDKKVAKQKEDDDKKVAKQKEKDEETAKEQKKREEEAAKKRAADEKKKPAVAAKPVEVVVVAVTATSVQEPDTEVSLLGLGITRPKPPKGRHAPSHQHVSNMRSPEAQEAELLLENELMEKDRAVMEGKRMQEETELQTSAPTVMAKANPMALQMAMEATQKRLGKKNNDILQLDVSGLTLSSSSDVASLSSNTAPSVAAVTAVKLTPAQRAAMLGSEAAAVTAVKLTPAQRASMLGNGYVTPSTSSSDLKPSESESPSPLISSIPDTIPEVRERSAEVVSMRPRSSDGSRPTSMYGQGSALEPTKCAVCDKTVYATERQSIEGRLFHKQCFRCRECNKVQSAGNFASMQGEIFCKPCFMHLFKEKGNYDEGFGKTPHKHLWDRKDTEQGSK